MRQYYAHLRLYRQQDQQYWTLGVHTQAESLGGLELQLKAFEAGLRVAGAGKLYLQDVNIDAPGNGNFLDIDDPNQLLELQYFLGLKRDRRHKAPPKTETEREALDMENEDGSQDQ